MDYFQKLPKNLKRKTLPHFYMNICSLNKNSDGLNRLEIIDIGAIVEPHVKKD